MSLARVRSSQGLGRIVGGFWRVLFLSLLLAAFTGISLHAQTRAYVVNLNSAGTAKSSSISVINIGTNTVIATIPIPGFAALFIAAAPDGKRVYTAAQNLENPSIGEVFVIDTSTNIVVDQISGINAFFSPLAVSPDSKVLYVGVSDGVAAIDTSTNSLITVTSIGRFITGLTVTPNGTRVYASVADLTGTAPGDLVVIDAATHAIVATVDGVGDPRGDAISPNGKLVYSSSTGPGAVFVTSATSNTVVTGPIPVGSSDPLFGPSRLAVSPNGAFVYVVIPGENTVAVIATGSNTVTKLIPVEISPQDLVFTPDGAFVYVTNSGFNTVSAISTATNSVTALIPVGSVPIGIAMTTLTTPFSKFEIKDLDIDRRNFTVEGSFTPGAGSSGINPAKQEVVLTIGDFTLTIPAGSFKPDHDNDNFRFKGRIKGMEVEFQISDEHEPERRESEQEFKFKVEAREAELSRQSNPVTVSLKIGNNEGTALVDAH